MAGIASVPGPHRSTKPCRTSFGEAVPSEMASKLEWTSSVRPRPPSGKLAAADRESRISSACAAGIRGAGGPRATMGRLRPRAAIALKYALRASTSRSGTLAAADRANLWRTMLVTRAVNRDLDPSARERDERNGREGRIHPRWRQSRARSRSVRVGRARDQRGEELGRGGLADRSRSEPASGLCVGRTRRARGGRFREQSHGGSPLHAELPGRRRHGMLSRTTVSVPPTMRPLTIRPSAARRFASTNR